MPDVTPRVRLIATVLVTALALTHAACSNARSVVAPTAAPAFTPTGLTISGVVRAAAAGPLAQVSVQLTRGSAPYLGGRAYTSASGAYGLYGLTSGDIEITASVEGFNPAVYRLSVDRDTTFDITLTPLVEPIDVSGRWSVTMSASPACRGNLPELARERQFDAVVTQESAQVRILLTGPSIEANHVPPDQFESWGSLAGSHLAFVIVGDTEYGTWSYPDLFQRVTPTQRVGIGGIIERAEAGPNEIRATMSGDIEWFDSSVKSGSDGRPPGVCRATDHSIVFRRP